MAPFVRASAAALNDVGVFGNIKDLVTELMEVVNKLSDGQVAIIQTQK